MPAAFLLALLLGLPEPALATGPRELPTLPGRSARHDVTPRGDGPRPLQSGTYTAKVFPLGFRITVPAGWRGGQGQSRQFKQPTSAFGWIVLSQGTVARARGAITIVTADGRTPSVRAVVAGLRTRGHGASYGPTTPATIAGLRGSQFDGRVEGQGHVFVPFSPSLHVATFYADAFAFDAGELFRVLVLDVRGKTVVIFLETAALSPGQFPAFLDSATQILGSLRLVG
ncbi:MAG: hypothetical protein ABI948_10635 [Thermoleophilia bacterium]